MSIIANHKIRNQIQIWIAGDDDAFRAIFDYFRPRLLATSIRVLKNSEDAEELVMNVLLKLWQLRDKANDIEQFEDYVFGIMRQQIAGLMRKRVLQTQSLDTMPMEFFGSTSQPEISHKEIMELYHAALDKMPQQRKKIFLMSREEAMSNAQIAEKMGLSIHTVNNHIKASLKGLKKEFNDNPEIVGYVLAFSPSVLMVI